MYRVIIKCYIKAKKGKKKIARRICPITIQYANDVIIAFTAF